MQLGTYSSGFVWGAYTLSSLIFAAPLVNKFGAQEILLLSLVMYVLFAVLFMAAAAGSMSTVAQWGLVITGSIMGGSANGLGWVSQGVYFATASEAHAREQVSCQASRMSHRTPLECNEEIICPSGDDHRGREQHFCRVLRHHL